MSFEIIEDGTRNIDTSKDCFEVVSSKIERLKAQRQKCPQIKPGLRHYELNCASTGVPTTPKTPNKYI